jgi:hypothetical protein
MCTLKMAALLQKYHYSPDMNFSEAKATIDAIAKNGWRRPVKLEAGVV